MVSFATTTIEKTTMQLLLFFVFFSFLLRSSLSLSLSLLSRVIEDFLYKSGKRVNGLFLRFFPVNF